jgi:hypothetical protein
MVKATEIQKALSMCKFNPKTDLSMKPTAEMGSQEFYTHRIVELAGLANLERIQKNPEAMVKHIQDLIKVGALVIAYAVQRKEIGR